MTLKRSHLGTNGFQAQHIMFNLFTRICNFLDKVIKFTFPLRLPARWWISGGDAWIEECFPKETSCNNWYLFWFMSSVIALPPLLAVGTNPATFTNALSRATIRQSWKTRSSHPARRPARSSCLTTWKWLFPNPEINSSQIECSRAEYCHDARFLPSLRFRPCGQLLVVGYVIPLYLQVRSPCIAVYGLIKFNLVLIKGPSDC